MSNTRLKRDKKISFLNGNHISRLPFGYKKTKNGEIVFVEEQIEIVKKIFEIRKFGKLGYHSIARELKLFDYKNKPRKIFVKNILENLFYTGFIRYSNKIVVGKQHSIITKEEFCSLNNKYKIEELN